MKKLLYILLFVPLALFGQENYSLSFDGVNDYVDCGNANDNNILGQNATWMAWVKCNDLSSHDVIISKWLIGGDSQWSLGRYDNNGENDEFYLTLRSETAGYNENNSIGVNLQEDQWLHITVVWSNDSIKFYKNSLLLNTLHTGSNSLIETTGNLIIGAVNNGTMHNFNGEIDDIMLWNRELTQQEIQVHMECSPLGIEEGLIGYWNFNEGSGYTVYDSSGNGNNGIINGATYSEDVPEQNCELESVLGCIDSEATNYNSESIEDDGSCIYSEYLAIDLLPNDTTICEGDSIDLNILFDTNDSFFSNVVFQMNAEDSLSDESCYNWPVYSVGSCSLSSEGALGDYSIEFETPDSYLHTDLNSVFSINDDATIEFWYKIDATPINTHRHLFAITNGNNWPDDNYIQVTHYRSGLVTQYANKIGFQWKTNLFAGDYPLDNQWEHIALVRDGNMWRLYMGGIQVLSQIDDVDLNVPVRIELPSNYGDFTGSIDGVRVTNGICRYPGGVPFDPPTELDFHICFNNSNTTWSTGDSSQTITLSPIESALIGVEVQVGNTVYTDQIQINVVDELVCSLHSSGSPLDDIQNHLDSIANAFNSIEENAVNSISSLQQALDTWNTAIDLSAGWNMFGYGCPSPIDVAEGLSNHTESIEITKDNNGAVYMPEWGFNGIGDFTPGFGYQIKLTEAIEGFSLCDWYVNDIPEDNIVSLQEEVEYMSQYFGCVDALACNYYAEAVIDDESCIYPEQGLDCDGNELPQYQVGDFAEGGIVFYVDETGDHGLVAALEDIGQFEWGCYGTELSGADGQAIGTGYQNTLDIVSGCSETPIAASEALAYESGGYSDWYLPSLDELYEMYNTIGNGGPEGNIGGFSDFWYWSSSEGGNSSANFAWGVYFNFGATTNGYKSLSPRVRAVRAF